MILPRVQYITHPNEDFSNLIWLDRLKAGGVNWVQLRIKEDDLAEEHAQLHYKHTFMEIADLVREKTKGNDMLLTINDHPDVARFSSADGVHFGLTDNVTSDELAEFGIIGGTIHQVKEIENYADFNLNYLGMGPFSDTLTKKNTKSPLGLLGFDKAINKMRNTGINIPVYAIGGIEVEDVSEIMETGVYGIALSGQIHHSNFDVEIIKKIVQKVENGK
jgi:thiamine-phosphate pyrophosphorylase